MGVNIAIDWSRLAIDLNAPVTLNEKNIQYSELLTRVLGQVSDPNNPAAFAPVNDVLVISTADGMKVYADLEDSLAGAKMSDALREQLGRRLPALDLDGAGLATALDSLNSASGPAIKVDWAALQAAGVQRNVPLHLHLRHISVGQALCVILGGVNSSRPIHIAVRGDKLELGS